MRGLVLAVLILGSPPVVEKINVSVVNVDVTVTDRAGRAVPDLTAADFEVFEDGRPQKISNFYVVDRAAVREEMPARTAAPAARFRRKVVLLVDNHFIDKRRRDEAIRELRKFIESDYAGEYEWSVGVIGGGVHVIQPFTSDKATLDALLDRLLRGGTIAPVVEMDGGAVADPKSDPASRNASVNAMFGERSLRMEQFDKDVRFTSVIAAFRASARAVIDACRALAPMDGKKLIVLVNAGMEIENRPLSGSDLIAENDRDTAEIREAMVREANAANVNLYLVNAAGVVSPVPGHDVTNRIGTSAFRAEVRNLDSLPSALAAETGGMYLTGNVVSQSIRTIDTVSATFYSLGYTPPHPEDGEYHRIEVRVKRPGCTVRSRAGYFAESEDQRLEESLKVAVSTFMPRGALPVQVEIGPRTMRGQVSIVPVTASVPLAKITTIRQGRTSAARLHIYLSVFDVTDANVGFHHAVKDLEFPSAPDANFRYTMRVDLKRGVYRAMVVVRDELSEEAGRASTTIVIP